MLIDVTCMDKGVIENTGCYLDGLPVLIIGHFNDYIAIVIKQDGSKFPDDMIAITIAKPCINLKRN